MIKKLTVDALLLRKSLYYVQLFPKVYSLNANKQSYLHSVLIESDFIVPAE